MSGRSKKPPGQQILIRWVMSIIALVAHATLFLGEAANASLPGSLQDKLRGWALHLGEAETTWGELGSITVSVIAAGLAQLLQTVAGSVVLAALLVWFIYESVRLWKEGKAHLYKHRGRGIRPSQSRNGDRQKQGVKERETATRGTKSPTGAKNRKTDQRKAPSLTSAGRSTPDQLQSPPAL
jgi:uncharacterized SAM-binding protein YcdF (DUF218 family)